MRGRNTYANYLSGKADKAIVANVGDKGAEWRHEHIYA